MAGFEFNGMVAQAAQESSNPFAIFDDAVQSSARSLTALVNARNTVRDALNGGQTVAASSGTQTPAASSGIMTMVLFGVLAVVLVKVLK